MNTSLNIIHCILDDNIAVDSEKIHEVAPKQNGKTVRFQTETEKTSHNDHDSRDDGKDKENIQGDIHR